MKFKNNEDVISVDLESRQVILKEINYDMLKIDLLGDKQSKFTFDVYSVKINNGKLSLYDSQGNLINTFIQIDGSVTDIKDFDKYIIYKNNYLYVDKKRTNIIVNNQEFPIISHTKIGTSDVYGTSEGLLSISSSDRPSSWNGITIEMVLI